MRRGGMDNYSIRSGYGEANFPLRNCNGGDPNPHRASKPIAPTPHLNAEELIPVPTPKLDWTENHMTKRNQYLAISLSCFAIGALIIIFALTSCSGRAQGDCVPRGLFNATTWAIEHKTPVYIADVIGHWQAVGLHNGELHYLVGYGWDTWPGDKEGDHPIYKLRNLRDAVEHFIRFNPWCMPTPEQQAELDARVRATFGTDPADVGN